MESVIASEAACWVHIDRENPEWLVFTRGAEPNDRIRCPVKWFSTIAEIVKRDAPETFKAWVDEHMTDTLDAHYDAGFGDGYRLGFGEGPRA